MRERGNMLRRRVSSRLSYAHDAPGHSLAMWSGTRQLVDRCTRNASCARVLDEGCHSIRLPSYLLYSELLVWNRARSSPHYLICPSVDHSLPEGHRPPLVAGGDLEAWRSRGHRGCPSPHSTSPPMRSHAHHLVG